MTAQPYWPHSNPEPPIAADHSARMGGNADFRTYEAAQAPLQPIEGGHVAEPPSECVNGCHTGHGDSRRATETEGDAQLCHRCIKRLDTWLRIIPDAFRWLLWVKDHGSVAGNPESAHTKRPDAPAPMRLEIIDLLDNRDQRGVLGIAHGWAQLIRDERRAYPDCSACRHPRSKHVPAIFGTPCGGDKNCACAGYTQSAATVAGECAFIGQHLAWVTEQDWVGDLYAELRPLARELGDAVGDYRPAAIGMCLAEVDAPGLLTKVLCGGALYRDQTGHGVHCVQCGDRTDVDTLRRLGLKIGILSDDHQEAS